MTGDVPPARQCTMSRCDQEATNPDADGSLCERHIDALDGDSPGENPGFDADKPPHDNPIDAADVTDAERAAMLREYLAAFADEFGEVPRLMPLDEEGKAPIIQGRARLDSPEGRAFLVDGVEAIRQIREEGARGFALYAGKWDHGTADAVFVDHDDDSFSTPTGEPTLEVLTGSGRGEHETYRNAGDVRNARVGDNVGEIRAENWYVVAPGSIHPTGGVYHVAEQREIATLADEDLTDEMRPNSGGEERDPNPDAADLDGEGETPDDDELDDRLQAAFDNSHDGQRIKDVYNGNYAAAGFGDRSAAEFWLANRLDSWIGQGNPATVERILDDANLEKWSERTDRSYRDSVLTKVGEQDWYYDPDGSASDSDPVAVLPATLQARATASEWDWRREADDGGLTIQTARDRCQSTIEYALEHGDNRLVEALPTLGKSSGAIRAAAATGEPITVLTGRGRKEQYEQFREWCRDQGLDYYTLPSFAHDCDTANGEHGDEWRDRVMDWYRRGATPQDIHKHAEYELGRPLPCQAGDHDCSYSLKWNFEADDYDVLIGHYAHAHTQKATAGRTVVFDEFPGGVYETTLDRALPGAVSYFLQCHDGIPFDDFADLIEHRDDQQRRADALLWFEEHEVDSDSLQAMTDAAGHAAAPVATFILLASDDLGNGFEHVDLDEHGAGVFNRAENAVSILRPPELDYASGIVALDGTPTMEMWQLAIGRRLNDRQVLTDDERAEYIRDVLGLSLVSTTDAVKSYSPSESKIASRVSLQEDAALLEAIGEEHGEQPALITTSRAEDHYDEQGVLDLVDDCQHYGNVLGSNRYAQRRVGAVVGSRNFGPDYVKKWGAYLGETIEPTFPGPENDFAPTDYGPAGNEIRTHMREHETLQAAMRFGRDGNGAAVYVHTNTLPDWVPTAGEGRVLHTRSPGEREVIAAARELDEWSTAELAAHPGVSIGERQVRTHLTRLVDAGVVDREIRGCGFVWRDDGLHRLGEHGDVELEPVDVEDLTAEESAEVARNSTYRWDFRTSGASEGNRPPNRRPPVCAPEEAPADGGDRPPDDPA